MSVPDQSNNPLPLVAPLDRFDHTDLELAGGKGANLGELTRAGFDIPPGFVITTAAYDLLLKNNGLQARIADMLASLDSEDPASVTQVSQRIRQSIQTATIPAQVSKEIINAYRRLGHEAVAVRSSATTEDLPAAAFAGQQETLLNVSGDQAVLDAVRTCWASLWSERAIAYRAHQKVDQATVKLAAVVQQMVPAQAAGVMFTANPVSGARGELVIDANPGLGEAVVGGMVTPDHFVVSKRSRRVIGQSIGRREVIIRAKAGGGTEQISPGEGQNTMPAVPPPAIERLTQLGIKIERHYGTPQDIEWAWVSNGANAGKILILQARPITALPEPVKTSGPMRLVIPMLVEMWPSRPYPLDMTTFTGTIEGAIGNLLVTMIGKSAPNPNTLLVEEDGVVMRFEPPALRPAPAMLIMPWLTLWRTRHDDPLCWQADPQLTQVVARASELGERDIHALTWEQNIETLHEALALIPLSLQLRERYIPQTLLSLGILWALLALARRGDRLGPLLSGVETKTTETNRALESLAGEIRADAPLRDLFARHEPGELLSALQNSPSGQAFQNHFAAFLAQYGHRETSLTISEAAWKDNPEVVLGILKVLAVSEPKDNTNAYRVWEQVRDDLLAHSVLGAPPLRKTFLKALSRARCLIQIREDTHFYATLVQPLVRGVAFELGWRLEQVGALDTARDVFHLKLEELEPLGASWPPSDETRTHILALARRRKAKRQVLGEKPMFDPRLLALEPHIAPGESVILSGSAGSPGIASGTARIVHDSSEFGKLQPGDVLVAPVTNPSWTPLFQRSAAVVVDTGGIASHAAIVAREYGIPAVMGTVNGTQKLKDGQWIRVDGARALVLEAEKPQ
jgi:rifampicin phosphotransferase